MARIYSQELIDSYMREHVGQNIAVYGETAPRFRKTVTTLPEPQTRRAAKGSVFDSVTGENLARVAAGPARFNPQTGKELGPIGRFFADPAGGQKLAFSLGSLSAAISGENAAGRVGAAVRDVSSQQLFTDFTQRAAHAIARGDNPSLIPSFGLTPEQRSAGIAEAQLIPAVEQAKLETEREFDIKERALDVEEGKIQTSVNNLMARLAVERGIATDRDAVTREIAQIRADSAERIATERERQADARLSKTIKFDTVKTIENLLSKERAAMTKVVLVEMFKANTIGDLTDEELKEFNAYMSDVVLDNESIRRAELAAEFGMSPNAIEALRKSHAGGRIAGGGTVIPPKAEGGLSLGDVITDKNGNELKKTGYDPQTGEDLFMPVEEQSSVLPPEDRGVQTGDFSIFLSPSEEQARRLGMFVTVAEKQEALKKAEEQVAAIARSAVPGSPLANSLSSWQQYIREAKASIESGEPLRQPPGAINFKSVFVPTTGASSPKRKVRQVSPTGTK